MNRRAVFRGVCSAAVAWTFVTACGSDGDSPHGNSGDAGDRTDGSGSDTGQLPPDGGSACDTCGGLQREAPWPTEGHDIRNQRRGSFPGPASPSIVWKADIEDVSDLAPTVDADGAIYAVGGQLGSITAFRPDGSRLPLSYSGGGSPPTIASTGFLYFTSPSGALSRARVGSPTDTTIYKGSFETIPVIDSSGTVYIGGTYFAALSVSSSDSANSATALWTDAYGCGSEICYTGAPAIAPDGSLRFQGKSTVRAVERDGHTRWTFDLADGVVAVGDDGTTYAQGRSKRQLHAIDANGNQLFTRESWAPVAIASDGTIYVQGSDAFYALRKDGTEIASFPACHASNRFTAPAIDSEGTVYTVCGEDPPILYALDSSLKEKWSLPFTYLIGSPTIGLGRRLYIAASEPTDGGGFTRKLFAIGQP